MINFIKLLLTFIVNINSYFNNFQQVSTSYSAWKSASNNYIISSLNKFPFESLL